LADTPPFPRGAPHHLANARLRTNLRRATGTIRAKRAIRAAEVPEWEELRTAAAAIKDRTLRHLDYYLLQAEENLTAAGAHVHWAADADEACAIVSRLVRTAGAEEVVKVKSMATQEIGLNEALERDGIAAWETDLAELIVQLGHDRPSHILVPAIHRGRAEVREIFQTEMGRYGAAPPSDLSSEPAELAGAARTHLREKFLRAQVAVSGANMVVAETGTLAIVESEGNGRMCLTLPQTLISVVGIEKIVPTIADLEVFLRLLPRSATGERMNPYTSMWTGVTPGDGPQNVHVVFLDAGRTRALADAPARSMLRCIRCSACMNVCPVYEKVGGHAYGSVYPGPIGIVLTPELRGFSTDLDRSLPFASTLCYACADVCPVKIPLPDLIVRQRHKVVLAKARDPRPHLEAVIMRAGQWAFTSGRRWGLVQRVVGAAVRVLGRRTHLGPLPWPASRWTRARDLPVPPGESFRAWWRSGDGDGCGDGCCGGEDDGGCCGCCEDGCCGCEEKDCRCGGREPAAAQGGEDE
jgi:L-lactate dehydrogenase complex protein LldF